MKLRGGSGVGLAPSATATCAFACEIYKFLYTSGVPKLPKPLRFRATSLRDLRAFPQSVKREAGHQLDRVQAGKEPDDWKPMSGVGSGAIEIRIHDTAGAFRVICVAKFEEAVFVLHCFQKKTQTTSKADLVLATTRYRELAKELGR